MSSNLAQKKTQWRQLFLEKSISLEAENSEVKLARFSHPWITPFEVSELATQASRTAFSWKSSKSILAVIDEIWRTTEIKLGNISETILLGGRAGTVMGILNTADCARLVSCLQGPCGAAETLCNSLNSVDEGWMICDLGLTNFKIAFQNKVLAFPRNFTLQPIDRPGYSPHQRLKNEASLTSFISTKIKAMGRIVGAVPQRVLLGLCSRVNEHGVAISSGYAGLNGSQNILPNALRKAGVPSAKIFVLNDAELAALAVLPQLPARSATPSHRVLVLTMGSSIGAAVIEVGAP